MLPTVVVRRHRALPVQNNEVLPIVILPQKLAGAWKRLDERESTWTVGAVKGERGNEMV